MPTAVSNNSNNKKIIIIINSEFRTLKRDLSMSIITELTLFNTAIKSSISEARKAQVLYTTIK